MKNSSITITTAVVLASIAGYGQNYQTIQSDEVHYFSTQEYSYVLASKTESVEVSGSDSIFYSFQTVREDENVPEGEPCHYYLGAPWTGLKTVIKPDGRNIFYNKNNEPITIQTQAVEDDTFLVYTYPSGDWIKGVVTNQLEIFILNGYDNIKIIELFSNVPLQTENDRIILSQHNGFVETFAFYSFPEPYSGASSLTGDNSYPTNYTGSFELVGIDTSGFHKPTTADVYDYEVGDEFKTLTKKIDVDGNLTEKYTEKKVVNKFIWPNDSIVYFTQTTEQLNQYSPSEPTQSNTYEGELSVETYYNPTSWNTAYLPEEFNGSDGWSVLLINSCGDVEEVIRTQTISWDGQGTCLDQEMGTNLQFSVINGVGWIGKSGITDDGAEYSAELVYYQKAGGWTCGSNAYLGIDDSPNTSGISLFPNPSSGDVFLNLDEFGGDNVVTVIDKSGRIVRVWKTQDSGIQMDISDLPPGVYVVSVDGDAGTQQEKLVKI